MQRFPSTVGSYRAGQYDGGQAWFDGAAGKLGRDGQSLAWGSFIGGHNQNNPFAGAVDAGGRYVQVGYTKAADYPLVHPDQPVFGGDHDATVTMFSADGLSLVWSTYLGDKGYDAAYAVAFDERGRVWVGGQNPNGAFIARYAVDGQIQYFAALDGQAVSEIACVPGYVIMVIADGDDSILKKEAL